MDDCSKIRVGDAASWYNAWSSYADRLYDLAVKSHAAGHRVSARNAFLRASNYYRTAYIFMFALPIDPRVIEAYEKQTDSFQKAAALFEQPIEVLKIPYQNTTLPGYFIKPDGSNTARKTFLCTGGYDGTCEELFFSTAGGALERGYNVLIFDGPGQGGALVMQKLPMRADWENVVTPWLIICSHGRMWIQLGLRYTAVALADISRRARQRSSIGLLLVSRTLHCLTRQRSVNKMFPPEIANALAKNDVAVLEPFFNKLQENTTQRFILGRGMWVHGATTPWEYFKMFQAYSLPT